MEITMRNILFFAIFTISLMGRSISAQSYDPGTLAYMEGDFQTAMQEWQLLAEQGNVGAQFNLGRMYLSGEGVQKNGPEAMRWFRMAANQGDAQAQFNMAMMYERGEGVPVDFAKAFIWYTMASLNGLERAEANREYVQAKIDESQLREVMQMAVDCLHSDYLDCE